MVTLATQMAGILSLSQLNAIFGQYRQARIRALAASPGVAVAEGWQDSSQPSLDQVYKASTLDTVSERASDLRGSVNACCSISMIPPKGRPNGQPVLCW